jgi:hypothetical protein
LGEDGRPVGEVDVELRKKISARRGRGRKGEDGPVESSLRNRPVTLLRTPAPTPLLPSRTPLPALSTHPSAPQRQRQWVVLLARRFRDRRRVDGRQRCRRRGGEGGYRPRRSLGRRNNYRLEQKEKGEGNRRGDVLVHQTPGIRLDSEANRRDRRKVGYNAGEEAVVVLLRSGG